MYIRLVSINISSLDDFPLVLVAFSLNSILRQPLCSTEYIIMAILFPLI